MGHGTRPAGTAMIAVGYVFAVVFPVIGAVLGAIVLNSGRRKHGIGIVALSIVVAAVSYAWLF